MRIAMTGASGFIGLALCSRLSGAGHALRALVRAPARELEAMGCEQLAVGALEEFAAWPRALEGADAIVHLAAHAHGRGAGASLDRLNVDATLAAAAAARDAGARFVFVSSIKVHGERSTAPLREYSPLAPHDAYALSKVKAEQALRALAGLRPTVLRPPLVYGPGVKANFLALLRAIARGLPLPLASIDNRRSLVYVGNLADAVARCLDNPRSEGRTYLVTDGEAVSTPALCREIGVALERPARLFPFPQALLPVPQLTQSLEADASAIRGELGWQPPFSLREGLRATARWYRGR
jgi:nucleoside-diphosphate-sugar epimerase